MDTQPQLQKSTTAAQLGSTVLCQIAVESPMAPVRAAAWFNQLNRLGIHLPFFIVRDVGLLLTTRRGMGGWRFGEKNKQIEPSPIQGEHLRKYRKILEKAASSDVIAKCAAMRLRDEIIAILILRSLGDIYDRWRDPTKAVATGEIHLEMGHFEALDRGALFPKYNPGKFWGFLQHFNKNALHFLTCLELVDMDTVRLLGLFREDSYQSSNALGSSIDLVDLVSAMGSTEASDVSSFSLDLLPSVLESKRASGTQTFAVDGYSSVERKGNVDSLMLSELAYEADVFEQKVIDKELLYFGHERQKTDEKRVHYILVDSSASMRGRRRVFARGLALALAKKRTLQGDEVWFRFFDSKLHELVKAPRGGDFPVPYVLSFRSERGRYYAKVFQQLLLELSSSHREEGKNIVVYIVTHGQCHIPPELIQAMSAHAYLYGIIILPSNDISLEFVPHLHGHQVVDAGVFAGRVQRKKRALDILDNLESASSKDTGEGVTDSAIGSAEELRFGSRGAERSD